MLWSLTDFNLTSLPHSLKKSTFSMANFIYGALFICFAGLHSFSL